MRYRFGRTEPALIQVRSSRFRPPQVRSGRFGPGSVGVPQVRSQPNLYSRRFGRNRTLYGARNLCGTQVRSRPNLCEHRFGRQPNPCLPRFGRRTEPVHEQVPSQPNPCLPPRFGRWPNLRASRFRRNWAALLYLVFKYVAHVVRGGPFFVPL